MLLLLRLSFGKLLLLPAHFLHVSFIRVFFAFHTVVVMLSTHSVSQFLNGDFNNFLSMALLLQCFKVITAAGVDRWHALSDASYIFSSVALASRCACVCFYSELLPQLEVMWTCKDMKFSHILHFFANSCFCACRRLAPPRVYRRHVLLLVICELYSLSLCQQDINYRRALDSHLLLLCCRPDGWLPWSVFPRRCVDDQ